MHHAAADYQAICLANIAAIADRFAASYPFVDTTLALKTGRAFPAVEAAR